MSCGLSPVSMTVTVKPSRSRSQAAMKPARSASAGAPSASERSGSIRPMRVARLRGAAPGASTGTVWHRRRFGAAIGSPVGGGGGGGSWRARDAAAAGLYLNR